MQLPLPSGVGHTASARSGRSLNGCLTQGWTDHEPGPPSCAHLETDNEVLQRILKELGERNVIRGPVEEAAVKEQHQQQLLPEGEKHHGLDEHELAQGPDGRQVRPGRVVEDQNAIQGPALAHVHHRGHVWVSAQCQAGNTGESRERTSPCQENMRAGAVIKRRPS